MHPPPAFTASRLPSSSSPSLSLVPATPAEKEDCWRINAQSWRGALDVSSYLQREQHLQNQEQNRDGGIVFWILVDTTLKSDNTSPITIQNGFTNGANRTDLASATNCGETQPRHIFASCESLRKRAMVSRGGKHEEILVWGVGSVFVREEYRGRGYAGRMMDELGRKLETWGQENNGKTAFTVLFSDIGKVWIYGSCLPYLINETAARSIFHGSFPMQSLTLLNYRHFMPITAGILFHLFTSLFLLFNHHLYPILTHHPSPSLTP